MAGILRTWRQGSEARDLGHKLAARYVQEAALVSDDPGSSLAAMRVRVVCATGHRVTVHDGAGWLHIERRPAVGFETGAVRIAFDCFMRNHSAKRLVGQEATLAIDTDDGSATLSGEHGCASGRAPVTFSEAVS